MKYRAERLFGEGYRDALDVMDHETRVLGNSDIPEHLARTYLKGSPMEARMRQLAVTVATGQNVTREQCRACMEEALAEIKRITASTVRYCLWLCDTKEDIRFSYDIHDSLTENDFDAYEESDIVLADLGREGKLYGYETYPEPAVEGGAN